MFYLKDKIFKNPKSIFRVIESDPNLTTREVAGKLRRTHGTIHYHFNVKQLFSRLRTNN